MLTWIKKNITRLVDVMRTFRNWPFFVFNYLTGGRIGWKEPRAVLRNGICFNLDPQAVEFSRAIVKEVWHDEVYALPFRDMDGKTVIDVGANIGAFTLFAASKTPGARVLAFEPGDTAFHLLEKNIRLNACSERVEAFPVAVTGQSGTREFRVSTISSSRCSLYENAFLQTDSDRTFTVDALSLEDLFAQHKIAFCDYLKMDCEGAEFEIFDAVPADLLSRIGRIGMEYHEKAANREIREIQAKLESAGFEVTLRLMNEAQGFGILTAVRNTDSHE